MARGFPEVAGQGVELLSGSDPGTIRIDSLARASGMRPLDDPAMVVMSTPMAEIDG